MVNDRVSTNTNNNNKTKQDITNRKTTKQREVDQVRLFKLKHGLLKLSVDLRTAFSADTHLAKGQWLKEQLKVLKLRMFRVGTRMPTVSRTEEQCLVPLKTIMIIIILNKISDIDLFKPWV
jgi:hypothetical protein